MSGLSPDDIDALVQLFDATDWDQLDLLAGEFELHLSKSGRPTASTSALSPPPAAPVADKRAPDNIAPAPAPGAPLASSAIDRSGLLEVRAPHLGTFYRSPKPGAPPYIEVGQDVQAETEVCLLEVMKLFTTMRAGVAGTIREVCVTDSALVESGQLLFVVDPKRTVP